MAGMGVEPTRTGLSGRRLCQFAYPADRERSAPGGIRTHGLHLDGVASIPGCSARADRFISSNEIFLSPTAVGPEGLEPSPAWLRARGSAARASVPPDRGMGPGGLEPPPPGLKGRCAADTPRPRRGPIRGRAFVPYHVTISSSVEVAGFEPAISCSQGRRIARLSHTSDSVGNNHESHRPVASFPPTRRSPRRGCSRRSSGFLAIDQRPIGRTTSQGRTWA